MERRPSEQLNTSLILQLLSKFLHVDWLIAIVFKSTEHNNDVRCNAHAFSMENKAHSACTFSMLSSKKKLTAVFYGLYSYRL